MKEWRVTHGKSNTPEYRAWHGMRQRCTNSSIARFKDYGGRGIKVCERWNSFENFLADMGERPTSAHSLDRFPNNDGNYEPGNCRWATRSEQQRNKRPPKTEHLTRGDAHWTRKDKERAVLIARTNIRLSHKSGEANNNAKMTFARAEELRLRHKENPTVRLDELGRQFGIGREQTRKIVKGLAWL